MSPGSVLILVLVLCCTRKPPLLSHSFQPTLMSTNDSITFIGTLSNITLLLFASAQPATVTATLVSINADASVYAVSDHVWMSSSRFGWANRWWQYCDSQHRSPIKSQEKPYIITRFFFLVASATDVNMLTNACGSTGALLWMTAYIYGCLLLLRN